MLNTSATSNRYELSGGGPIPMFGFASQSTSATPSGGVWSSPVIPRRSSKYGPPDSFVRGGRALLQQNSSPLVVAPQVWSPAAAICVNSLPSGGSMTNDLPEGSDGTSGSPPQHSTPSPSTHAWFAPDTICTMLNKTPTPNGTPKSAVPY